MRLSLEDFVLGVGNSFGEHLRLRHVIASDHVIVANNDQRWHGDVAETIALKNAFGAHAAKLAVSSTKSMTGHLLGAAGVVEAIFCVLAIRDQVVPPTINLDNPGEGCDLDHVPHTARRMKVDTAVSNSFGFGGTNGTLIFRALR